MCPPLFTFSCGLPARCGPQCRNCHPGPLPDTDESPQGIQGGQGPGSVSATVAGGPFPLGRSSTSLPALAPSLLSIVLVFRFLPQYHSIILFPSGPRALSNANVFPDATRCLSNRRLHPPHIAGAYRIWRMALAGSNSVCLPSFILAL